MTLLSLNQNTRIKKKCWYIKYVIKVYFLFKIILQLLSSWQDSLVHRPSKPLNFR